MKKLLSVLLMLLLLSACAPETQPLPEFTADEFPRIDGSTATIPLAEAVIATLLGIPRDEAAEKVTFTNTNQSFYELDRGNADVLIVYEPPAETMAEYADDFEMTPIGRDALVFLVNAANPVADLSPEQILGIYGGEITDWSQVGGDAGEILAYRRNETSGSETMFLKLVASGTDVALARPPAALTVDEMGGLVAAVASFENGPRAIGYNVFFYVTEMLSDPDVKLLSVGGTEPSRETVASGDYPYVNNFYAVIRKDAPENSPARKLYDWLCGDQCRELMRRENYVAIEP